MELISKEIIINSLFLSGYDCVDNYTYCYLLDRLISSNDSSFCFVNENFSPSFLENVSFVNGIYFFKDKDENRLAKLTVNEHLIDFINHINTIELVKYKLNFYGFESYFKFDDCFSSIEKLYRQLVFESYYKDMIGSVDFAILSARSK